MKILVIGGGAGGAGSAARCRRLDENADITIYEKSGFASYSNCGLPYKFSDEIAKFDDLIMTTPEELLKQYKLNVKVYHEVIKVNKDSKKITIKDLTTGKEFDESYDKLIIAAGAQAIKPDIKGVNDFDNIFILKTPDDVKKSETFIRTKKPKSVAIIGGGYIGVEIAENFKESGYKVTIVDAANQLMKNSLDKEFAAWIHKSLIDGKVDLKLNSKLEEVKEKSIVLSDGSEVDADFVFMTIGVKPTLKTYEGMGLEIGETGGIKVDQYQRTSVKDVYAIGDLADSIDIFGNPARTTLAFNASRQAVVAANTIYNYKKPNGEPDKFIGTTAASTISIFKTTAASTGYTEAELIKKGIKYNKTINARGANIGPVKGGGNVFLKVMYDDNFNILGAQSVGPEGAEKRVSYMSLAIQTGITYDKFMDFMVAYSPKVDTTYDATTMGARLALHQADGTLNSAFPNEVSSLAKEGWKILDVREKHEWDAGHMANSEFAPLSELRDIIKNLNKDDKFILHCKTGARSYNACLMMKANGFKNVKNLAGGYDFFTVVNNFGEI